MLLYSQLGNDKYAASFFYVSFALLKTSRQHSNISNMVGHLFLNILVFTGH